MAIEKGLERRKKADPKMGDFYLIHIFGIKVARYMAATVSCQSVLHNKPKDEMLVENIENAKKDFYKALGEFIEQYPTLPAVISAHLPALKELERKDWSKDETIAEILLIKENIFNPFRNELSIAV
ncbi:MAG: hypothetical protein NT093_00165 [Candidatus Moranbacteria bacterium]|nr:hypothetical protein [Candidatus Moranbacteria bacterium]